MPKNDPTTTEATATVSVHPVLAHILASQPVLQVHPDDVGGLRAIVDQASRGELVGLASIKLADGSRVDAPVSKTWRIVDDHLVVQTLGRGEVALALK